VALRLSIRPVSVALAVIQKLSQMFRTVENAGPNSKEFDSPGFTGAVQGDSRTTQALGCLFLRK
jgi:hypothetical protein